MLYLHTKTAFSSNNSIQRIINGPFCESRMIVEHMVAAAVIMVVSPVILPMGSVPDVYQC